MATDQTVAPSQPVVAFVKEVDVVEDDETQAKFLVKGLSDAGFKVRRASNGEDGLKLVLADHPALILLDVAMPGMNGISMLKQLRQDPWGKSVPVIVLSNYGDADKVADSLFNGVQFYFIKANVKVEDIIKKVKEVLEKKERDEQERAKKAAATV